ncbi:MAG: hypothetical protein ACREL3_01950, partial [Gemmatimonadales bacterium]
MLLYLTASLILLVPRQTGDTGQRTPSAPFWAGHPTADAFSKVVDLRLAHARKTRDRLVAAAAPRTIANTLVLYDDIQRDIDGASNEAHLIAAVHPDSAMRATAEAAEGRASKLGTEISLDRRIYV